MDRLRDEQVEFRKQAIDAEEKLRSFRQPQMVDEELQLSPRTDSTFKR